MSGMAHSDIFRRTELLLGERTLAVLKATKVDGIYTADPKKDPSATRFDRITFDEAISRNLAVMDTTAFALCRDRQLPINVFSIFKAGALKRVVLGENEGTLVYC